MRPRGTVVGHVVMAWANLRIRWQWLDNAVAWCERVIYCHHNARVLVDMEWRFGCTLNYCTKHMSKAYYNIEDIYAEIDEYIADRVEDAITDAVNDGELRRVQQ